MNYDPIVQPAVLGGPASYGSYAVITRMSKICETLSLEGKRVLDLGCGNGCYTVELARKAKWICGLDITETHLRQFRQQIPRVGGVGEMLPFADASFDVVIMIEVLEHTRSDSQVLRECYRVLKPGGLLILFVPNKLYPLETHPCLIGAHPLGRNVPFFSWLPDFLHRRVCYARIYSSRRLLSLVRAAGFGVNTVGYVFPPLDSFPLPFKPSYRRLAKRLERTWLRVFGVSIFAVVEKPAH